MTINQFEIWTADLNPRNGTESGKIRPVLVVQTNLLNAIEHPSTIVCPFTTIIKQNAAILRVNLAKGIGGLEKNCDIMIDQIRAIDNNRFIKKIGDLPESYHKTIKENIKIILEID